MGFRKIPLSSFAAGHPDQPNPFAHVPSAETGKDNQFVVFTLLHHLILPPIPLSLQPGSCAQFKCLFRRDMTPQTAGGAGTKKERAAAPFASSNSSAPPKNLPTNEGHPELPDNHTTPAANREDDPTAAADSTTEPPPADNCTSPNSQPVPMESMSTITRSLPSANMTPSAPKSSPPSPPFSITTASSVAPVSLPPA
ncbi:hypothetical protein PCANC_24116 [Puccinia coronata f. sp. avenae]|uniref:Uncharacterized protein n=1 Tax=Puccinia coronata f. sp. avenae TaxID=200324 RepID=A0A2N5SQW3_9BASI|nr:hypothetical protein PCANC_24116 [Puccinia coronata f. sp. avenae]